MQTLFDGKTFDPAHDAKRLGSQLLRVEALMRDGKFRTLAEIVAEVGGSEAGVSARLRDMRKAKHGGHIVERRRIGDPSAGLWAYRLVPDEPSNFPHPQGASAKE